MSLRSKILLLLLGTTLTLVSSLIALSLLTVHSAGETAQIASQEALEDQATEYLLAVTKKHAQITSFKLERTRAAATLLATLASQVFSQSASLGTNDPALFDDLMIKGTEGQRISSADETADVYIPAFVEDSEEIRQSWGAARFLDPLARQTLAQDPNVATIYVATANEITRVLPKLGFGKNFPPNYRITDYDFFKNATPDANPRRQTFWTDVYENRGGGGLRVSAIAPVYTDRGFFVGVIGIDFKLSGLASQIESTRNGKASYSFLVDGSGRTIAFPDQAYRDILGREPAPGEYGTDLTGVTGAIGELVQSVLGGEHSFRRISAQGIDKFVAYSPVEGTNWTIGTVVDAAVIFAGVDPLVERVKDNTQLFAVTKLLPTSLTILIIVTVAGFFLTFRLLTPLRQLTKAARDIGEQKWDTPLPLGESAEVGLLSRTVRGMADQLQDLVRNLEQRVEERTSELEAALHDRDVLERRFRLAFQSTPIGMGLLQKSGHILDANPALQALLERDDGSQLEYLFQLVIDEESELLDQFLQDVVNDEEEDSTQLFNCIAADGRQLQAHLTVTPILSAGEALDYLVLHLNDVTETQRLTRQLEAQANVDDLTGLLNRRAFEAELRAAYHDNHASPLCAHLLCADLDQFKVVNDTSGHTAGDELLKRVSELMKTCVRDSDVVARTGGDEFAFILKACPPGAAREVAEKIRATVEEFRFNWGDESYRIGISLGVAPIVRSLGSLEEIQLLADGACYRAKEGGRNQVHVVRGHEKSLLENRGEGRWAQRLREAMEARRFSLFGQLIRPANQQEEGEDQQDIEVLLRMRDVEKRRLIPPGAFMPAAERYGLSTELDRWVVKNLMKTLLAYLATGFPPARYWVNLSGSSIGDKRFGDFLIGTIASSPLPPGTVNFEITETAVIRNIDVAKKLMNRLREMGCSFALDDFGNGLSSFAYLKELPIDRLKIDGMFVRDIVDDESDRLFVKSIIDISHSLGIKTTAEFVENDAILEAVCGMGVDFVQGFGIHKPELLAPKFPGRKLMELSSPSSNTASAR